MDSVDPCRALAPGRAVFSLATLLLAAAPVAQVPFLYLVVADDGTSGHALRYVDPSTGIDTPVRKLPGSNLNLPRAVGVALDPSDPNRVYHVQGLSVSIAANIHQATVRGSHLIANAGVRSSLSGLAKRLHIVGTDALVTVANGRAPGLYKVPLAGGTPTLLAAMPDAFDVWSIQGLAWAVSWSAGQPSVLIEVDLANNTVRTISRNLPPVRAITHFPGGGLLAGNDAGDLILIDTSTGAVSPLASIGRGPILAVESDNSAVGHLALTDSGEIWHWPSLGQPVWRAPAGSDPEDFTVSAFLQASLLTYGDGCATTPVAPWFETVAEPSLGNSSFLFAIHGAAPLAPAVLMLGFSRERFGNIPLPLELGFLGRPGCHLLSDIAVQLLFRFDGAGDAGIPMPIPGAPRFAGVHFTAQAFLLDGNSDAAEGIIR